MRQFTPIAEKSTSTETKSTSTETKSTSTTMSDSRGQCGSVAATAASYDDGTPGFSLKNVNICAYLPAWMFHPSPQTAHIGATNTTARPQESRQAGSKRIREPQARGHSEGSPRSRSSAAHRDVRIV